MNLHNSVIDNASAETTIPDRILRTALTPWRQGNFVEAADQFSDVTRDYSPRQQERPGIRLPWIAVVGMGFVGATTAYALLLSGMAAEVVLIGRDPRAPKATFMTYETPKCSYIALACSQESSMKAAPLRSQ